VQVGGIELHAFDIRRGVHGHLKHGPAFGRVKEVGIGPGQGTFQHAASIAWYVFGVAFARLLSSLGRAPMLVYVRPSNEATDNPPKLARFSSKGSGQDCPLLRASSDMYAPSKLACSLFRDGG